MAEFPIMPLNVAALLADTRHMTTEQFGAYCRILFTMWLHGGQLVDNDEELARIAGISRTKLKNSREQIFRPMMIAGGIITQKRLTDTLIKTRDKRLKQAFAAHRRWRKPPDANA